MRRKIKDCGPHGLKRDKFRYSMYEVMPSSTDDSRFQTERAIKSLSQRRHGGAQRDHDRSHFDEGARGFKRIDQSIYHDVCWLMRNNQGTSHIDVQVRKGVVYLSGMVNDRRLKKIAEYESELVSGVVDVQNRIQVKTS